MSSAFHKVGFAVTALKEAAVASICGREQNLSAPHVKSAGGKELISRTANTDRMYSCRLMCRLGNDPLISRI